jgi:hypothetical protein
MRIRNECKTAVAKLEEKKTPRQPRRKCRIILK